MNETLVQVRQATRKNHIFNIIRDNNEQFSRFDLCKITKYSMTTVKGIVDGLIEEGLVCEDESKENRIGRRPSLLSIRTDGIYFAGVECSAAAVNFTIINAAQEIIWQQTVTLHNPMVADILSVMDLVLGDFSCKEPLIWSKIPALAFSLPGKLDCQTGVALRYQSIPDWHNIDVRSHFAGLGKEMYFINNVDSMLLGYRAQNRIDVDKSVMFIIIRNSAGVRLLSNGVLLSKLGVICEIGHMEAKNSSRRCLCGRIGCYDSELSVPGLQNKIMEACNLNLLDKALVCRDGTVSLADFFKLVAQHNYIAETIFDEVVGYTSEMLDKLCCFFKPDLIILSSYMCEVGEVFRHKLEHRLSQEQNFPKEQMIEHMLPANELASFGAAITGYGEYFAVIQAEI